MDDVQNRLARALADAVAAAVAQSADVDACRDQDDTRAAGQSEVMAGRPFARRHPLARKRPPGRKDSAAHFPVANARLLAGLFHDCAQDALDSGRVSLAIMHAPQQGPLAYDENPGSCSSLRAGMSE